MLVVVGLNQGRRRRAGAGLGVGERRRLSAPAPPLNLLPVPGRGDVKAARRQRHPTAWVRRRGLLPGVPRACREHAGDDHELRVEVLGVGPGEDGGDRAVWGPRLARAHLGVALRLPARLRRLRAEPRLCGAPPAAAHTRWYTETQGFGPGLRSVAKASFEPAGGLAGLALPRTKAGSSGDVSPADVGVETLGPRCARLALQAFRAHPCLLSTDGLGRPRPRVSLV